MKNAGMRKVNIHEAKNRLSQLVEEAASGRDVVVARAGHPVTRLTRRAVTGGKRRLGVLDGRFRIPGDLDRPLPNEVFFSTASLWEIVIKAALRRTDFRVDVGLLRPALAEMGFSGLAVSGAHAQGLASLAPIHKDPFDRMLVEQSLAEPLVLLTNDAVLAGYGDVVKVVQ
jgi:prevent-host-death family protein